MKYQYSITEDGKSIAFQESNKKKDLNVLVTEDLKLSAQCEAAAKTARSIMGMVHRLFKRLQA